MNREHCHHILGNVDRQAPLPEPWKVNSRPKPSHPGTTTDSPPQMANVQTANVIGITKLAPDVLLYPTVTSQSVWNRYKTSPQRLATLITTVTVAIAGWEGQCYGTSTPTSTSTPGTTPWLQDDFTMAADVSTGYRCTEYGGYVYYRSTAEWLFCIPVDTATERLGLR